MAVVPCNDQQRSPRFTSSRSHDAVYCRIPRVRCSRTPGGSVESRVSLKRLDRLWDLFCKPSTPTVRWSQIRLETPLHSVGPGAVMFLLLLLTMMTSVPLSSTKHHHGDEARSWEISCRRNTSCYRNGHGAALKSHHGRQWGALSVNLQFRAMTEQEMNQNQDVICYTFLNSDPIWRNRPVNVSWSGHRNDCVSDQDRNTPGVISTSCWKQRLKSEGVTLVHHVQLSAAGVQFV